MGLAVKIWVGMTSKRMFTIYFKGPLFPFLIKQALYLNCPCDTDYHRSNSMRQVGPVQHFDAA